MLGMLHFLFSICKHNNLVNIRTYLQRVYLFIYVAYWYMLSIAFNSLFLIYSKHMNSSRVIFIDMQGG